MDPADKARTGHRSPRPASERSRARRPTAAVADNRAQTTAQLELSEAIDGSARVAAQRALSSDIDASPHTIAQRRQLRGMFGAAVQLEGAPEEDDLLQGKLDAAQRKGPEDELLQGKAAQRAASDEELLQGRFDTVQREGVEEDDLQMKAAEPARPQASAAAENRTGIPDTLKSGIESLSGVALDGVKVHYNSPEPAQLNALAYAQGSNIHVAPGEEQHLPHEAWHVVQQAQGRVAPTLQTPDGVAINDSPGLEHEADVMGARAARK